MLKRHGNDPNFGDEQGTATGLQAIVPGATYEFRASSNHTSQSRALITEETAEALESAPDPDVALTDTALLHLQCPCRQLSWRLRRP